jgi:hypothetical protein
LAIERPVVAVFDRKNQPLAPVRPRALRDRAPAPPPFKTSVALAQPSRRDNHANTASIQSAALHRGE